MDQNPQEKPSREPRDGAGSELIPAQDVADVLAEASNLAAELARQLDPEETTPRAGTSTVHLPDLPNVDQQLDDVDALLAFTTHELSAAPTPADGSSEPQTELSKEEASQAVPDFMNEFTQPESSDAPGSSDESSAHTAADTQYTYEAKSGPKPGIVGTGIVGVVAAKPLEPQPATGDEPAAVGPRRRLPNPREQFAKLARLAVSALHRILARLFPLAVRGVGLLEKTDRPFAWMKEPMRRVTGWIAIATLGTSAFVFLWSLI